MSEYIFDVPDSNQPVAGDTSLYYPDERDDPMMVCEEIVRCRDCEFFEQDDVADGCTQFDFSIEYMERGYCAWASRKVDE